jgi:hypothetical protein
MARFGGRVARCTKWSAGWGTSDVPLMLSAKPLLTRL